MGTKLTHCRRCRFDKPCERLGAMPRKLCACCYDATIRHLVGKHHVAEGYLDVWRAVIRAIKGGFRAFHTYPREQRALLVRMVAHCHADNRQLYRVVMR